MEDKATFESAFAAVSKLVYDFEANETHYRNAVFVKLVNRLFGVAD